jgi:hypothetical protein
VIEMLDEPARSDIERLLASRQEAIEQLSLYDVLFRQARTPAERP